MSGREAEERELSRAEILSLPWPSAEQQAAFTAHVCWAHSWYKHLPLLAGGEFVVFLAADAGAGYSDEAPRLHYSWKTTAEYRDRFGYLDYMYRQTPTDRFGRDAAPAVLLPPDLLAATRLTLFPFVSSDFNAPDACSWGIHDEGFEQLRAGIPHPMKALILEWQDSRATVDRLWGGLTREDQDVAVRLRQSQLDTSSTPVPPAVAEFLRVASLADSVYAGLQRAEEAKVFGAIGNLAALLLRWAAEEAEWNRGEPGAPPHHGAVG
jgi:hypothetical protein